MKLWIGSRGFRNYWNSKYFLFRMSDFYNQRFSLKCNKVKDNNRQMAVGQN